MSGPARDEATRYWAPRAWVSGAWREQVLLSVGANGLWQAVTPDQPCPPDAQALAGPVLPGLVDAHSHAFQRAFAGLAEQREDASDDFWSWRQRMYGVALRITPEQLRAVAAQLYLELLRGGYTQVCEFHYLQHAQDGRPYADPLTLCQALAGAAADTGIGLTLLPVLYQRAGFTQPRLRDDQRRFATQAADVHRLAQGMAAVGHARLNSGVAVHSLRAATPEAMAELATLAVEGPLHIHVAEQMAEVDDCLAATGRRPIQWLAEQGLLGPRWQLVHATHALPAEIAAVAASGAGVVICPATEANLGDGLADLPGWLGAGVPLAIGSDSQVTRGWREELRWLDYGQRLLRRQRNVSAAPEAGQPSTAARLFQAALDGGGSAAVQPRWGLQAGARADLLVVDLDDASLLGIPPARLLDALVFSSPGRPFRDVMVAGHWAVQAHRQAGAEAIGDAFSRAMHELWRDA